MMNEYAKVILPNVQFNRNLFQKELVKCIRWTDGSEELYDLAQWTFEKFGDIYPDLLHEVFTVKAR